jgi:hypothetical protein
MVTSKGKFTLCPLLILLCASPAMTHCAKPAQLGSDTMHAMGMKGIVQRELDSCKSEAERVYRTGVQILAAAPEQEFNGSSPAKSPLPTSPNPFEWLPPESQVSPDRSRFDTAPGVPLPKARKYLENMFARIVEGTRKKGIRVFEGGLASDKFCLVAKYDDNENAYAYPSNGLLVVTTGGLLRGSEGQILDTLGHEVSHVLLDHGGGYPKSTFPKISEADMQQANVLKSLSYDLIDQFDAAVAIFLSSFSPTPDMVDTEYLKSEVAKLLKAKSVYDLSPSQLILGAYQVAVKEGFCRLSCDELKAAAENVATIERQLEDTRTKLKAIYGKYYSKEEVSNKSEADADELGMELALYAGGSPLYSLDFWYRILKEEDDSDKDAAGGDRSASSVPASPSAIPKKESKLSSCLNELGLGKTPNRDVGSHPKHCWRAYNIKRELEAHPELKAAAKRRPDIGLTNPTLEEVRAEIRDAVLKAKKGP